MGELNKDFQLEKWNTKKNYSLMKSCKKCLRLLLYCYEETPWARWFIEEFIGGLYFEGLEFIDIMAGSQAALPCAGAVTDSLHPEPHDLCKKANWERHELLKPQCLPSAMYFLKQDLNA